MTALAHLGNLDIGGRPFYTLRGWEHTYWMVTHTGKVLPTNDDSVLVDLATKFHITGEEIYIYDGRNAKELVK